VNRIHRRDPGQRMRTRRGIVSKREVTLSRLFSMASLTVRASKREFNRPASKTSHLLSADPLTSVSKFKGWSNEDVLMSRTKVRGRTLDRLCADKVFCVERGSGRFPAVGGCNSAYFTRLSPTELIELGTELIQAGTQGIKDIRT
jgi:hypothetical protein